MAIKNQMYFGLFFITLFIGFACSNSKVFEAYEKFDKLSWHRFNFLEFEVPIEDTETAYNVYISLRHLPEFRHKELPINLTIYDPSGGMRTADLVLELFDDDGTSLSKCLGDFCDISILVREEISFYETGVYQFRIENKWPKVDLPGIIEVGLLVKKSD